MSRRSTETTVTFRRSFTLGAIDGVQPPGTYKLVTEEEQITELSFVGFQRVATLLYLPADPAPGRTSSVVEISPAELADALAADAAAADSG